MSRPPPFLKPQDLSQNHELKYKSPPNVARHRGMLLGVSTFTFQLRWNINLEKKTMKLDIPVKNIQILNLICDNNLNIRNPMFYIENVLLHAIRKHSLEISNSTTSYIDTLTCLH